MPDDEGRRRRLGDETKNRIADLASGWSLDGADDPPAPAIPAHTPKPAPRTTPSPTTPPPGGQSARTKPRTSPPPPPGSPERKAIDEKSGAVTSERAASASGRITTTANPVAGEARGKPPSRPPASVPSSSDSSPRSGPQFKRADYAGPSTPFDTDSTFASEPHTPAVIVDESLSGPIAAVAAPSNPVGVEPSRPLPAAPAKPMPAAPSKPIAVAPSKPVRAAPSWPSPASLVPAPSRPSPAPVAAAPSRPSPAALSAPPSRPTPAPLAPPPAGPGKVSMPLPAPNQSSIPGLAVPVGEFDSGVHTVEQGTQRRDAADALLRIPTAEPDDLLEDDDDDEDANVTSLSEQRGDATMIDPQTAKFERGDPTQDATLAGGIVDATEIQGPGGLRLRHQSGGTLRPSAALRRKRGLAGDVRYVFTALHGARASRRELAELEHRQGLRQTSRKRHLVTLGRSAVTTDSLDHPALGKAREQLQAIEDERSRHAGAVSASDAELERVRRDRDAKAKQYIVELSAVDTELADLAKKLEPLDKEAATARKRGQELRESLQRIEKKIADTEGLLSSVKAEKMDKAGIQADIATYKADRQAVLRDEPVLAAQLDALNPRIAAIEGARAELRRKRAELEKAEVEDQRRTSELLEAIGAKRKVVERAAADAEAARDSALFELGDRLYVDRPKMLAAQLSPIDQIDLELGEGDRRTMELREILSNIDKAKLARGAAMIILALALIGSFVTWLVYALL